ncbi:MULTISPECIES: cell envelope integrity protein TolA [Burkholderiaceae]|uniref:cell envelope integrity protein TolA n=2 Tax=Burkholderiales TaxID=80840 RepID=UPI00095F039F|nr:cell envelope integrity protein TolA [Burkholderia sp. b14]SIT70854.1 Cell division and transport-associated protein TolA (TC 2.C.1.2.1) [Burkholderia sp. b14]
MKPKTGYPFDPPRERGTLRALALAALMHVLLALFLYHGMKWQNSPPAGAEAEIWTQVPSTPASPPPAPAPAPTPAQLAPPPAQREEADIALHQEKRRKQQEAERQAQVAEQERVHRQAEARRQQLAAQKAAAEKLKQQEAEKLREQQLAAQQRQEALKKQEALKAQQEKEQQEKLAQAKKQQEQQAAKAKQAAEQAARQKLNQARRARLAQLQGLAGDAPGGNGLAKSGTGTGSGGTATSAGYADKVQRRVRPNVIWSGPTEGLDTLIAVRCAPDGALLDARIARSSGNAQWDNAALRAVQRSDPMPLDTHGKAPASFNIRMRPAGG